MLSKKSPWKHLSFCLLFLLPIAVTHAQTGWWANPTEPRLYQYSGSLTTPDLIQIEVQQGSGDAKIILHGREALIFLLNRHYVAYDPQGTLYFTDKYLAWARSHNANTPGFGQLFNNVLGQWNFGRVGPPSVEYRPGLNFTSDTESGEYGYKLIGRHKNESFWNLTNTGELLIYDSNGTLTSRLKQVSANRWEGPFLDPHREFTSLMPITHYIKKQQPSFANTTFPPLRGQGWKFTSPNIDGLPLDWCHTWARNCGQGAATAFCQSKGYTSAVDFKGPNLAPKRTKIIGSGQICEGDFCGTFDYIICGS